MKCIFSWDDGSIHDLKLAELFSKYNCAFTLYIPTNNIEGRKVLSPSQIIDLSSICEIGSHTADHVPLNLLNYKSQRFQIEQGKKNLEDVLAANVNGFCFPRGKVTTDARSICEELGIKYARTIKPYYRDKFVEQQFYVHVTTQFIQRSLSRNILNLRRNLNITNFLRLSRHELFKTLQKIIYEGSSDDMIIHVWGHSWEVEQYHLWRELENLLKLISDTNTPTQTVMELYNEQCSLC